MSNCPYCGKKLVENERYCYHCENDTMGRENYKNIPTKPLKEHIQESKEKIKKHIKKMQSKIKKRKSK